jgi:hypothetical protein
MLGVLRIHQHEVCSGAADFCASCHQAKVFRFDMLAACLKAMDCASNNGGISLG